MSSKEDELIFLGSGGGRIHIRTQYRATGGILFKFNGIQGHIDPGPGAIVRINQYHEDPLKTELFLSIKSKGMWPSPVRRQPPALK